MLVSILAATALLLLAAPALATTTFTVTTTGDQPDIQITDDQCDVSAGPGRPCTLRAALEEANNTPGHDTIEFDIPGPGVKTIQPASELPPVAQRTTIDGYTQPGAQPNSAAAGTNAQLRIQLDGLNADIGSDGLAVTTGDRSVIRGLVVNRFSVTGIRIDSTASEVSVTGCFIGTNAAGTADRGNGDAGVDTNGADTSVGGSTPGARNLISGNGFGVLPQLDADGSRVLGNLIGTTKTGSDPLGNSNHGVFTSAADAFIGSNAAAAANVIAFNGADGVAVFSPGERNRIYRNSIFANGDSIFPTGDLGIDLGDDGVTANDTGDADTGANTLQNYPVITSATSNSVQGTLNSSPNENFFLRLFSNPGASNEGKFFEEGPLTVTTNGAGNANFSFNPSPPIPSGRSVTVTATNDVGNTSEFSAAEPVP